MSIDGFQNKKNMCSETFITTWCYTSTVGGNAHRMWNVRQICQVYACIVLLCRILIASETDFFTLGIALVLHHMNFFWVLTLIIFLLIKQMEAFVKLSDPLYHCIIVSLHHNNTLKYYRSLTFRCHIRTLHKIFFSIGYLEGFQPINGIGWISARLFCSLNLSPVHPKNSTKEKQKADQEIASVSGMLNEVGNPPRSAGEG